MRVKGHETQKQSRSQRLQLPRVDHEQALGTYVDIKLGTIKPQRRLERHESQKRSKSQGRESQRSQPQTRKQKQTLIVKVPSSNTRAVSAAGRVERQSVSRGRSGRRTSERRRSEQR